MRFLLFRTWKIIKFFALGIVFLSSYAFLCAGSDSTSGARRIEKISISLDKIFASTSGQRALESPKTAEVASKETGLNLDWKRKGQFSARVYWDTTDNTPYEDNRAIDSRLKLENKIRFKDRDALLKVSLECRYEAFINGGTEQDIDLLLEEAYFEIYGEKHNFSLGRQIVTWGKLDDNIILDKINPQEYKWFVLLDRQERKDPVFMFKLDSYGDNYQVEAVILPFFKPSYLRFFGSDWAVFGRLKEEAEDSAYSEATKNIIRAIKAEEKDKFTENTAKNIQAAFRLRGRIKDVDYGLYYMYLYASTPTLKEKTPTGNIVKKFLYGPSTNNLNQLTAANPSGDDLILEKEYPRNHIIGIDWETIFAQYGLRGELGFLLNRAYLRRDYSYVEKDLLSLGLNIDHTTANNFYYSFQVNEDIIFNYEDLFAQKQYTCRLMNTLRKDFLRGNLILDVSSSYNISQHDWMCNPKLTYKFKNGIDASIGVFLFGGEPATTLGRYSDKDSVYLETIYRF